MVVEVAISQTEEDVLNKASLYVKGGKGRINVIMVLKIGNPPDYTVKLWVWHVHRRHVPTAKRPDGFELFHEVILNGVEIYPQDRLPSHDLPFTSDLILPGAKSVHSGGLPPLNLKPLLRRIEGVIEDEQDRTASKSQNIPSSSPNTEPGSQTNEVPHLTTEGSNSTGSTQSKESNESDYVPDSPCPPHPTCRSGRTAQDDSKTHKLQ